MTPREIIAEYEHREDMEGGIAYADPRQIAEAIAREHGIPYEEVRDVLSQKWAMGGAG